MAVGTADTVPAALAVLLEVLLAGRTVDLGTVEKLQAVARVLDLGFGLQVLEIERPASL